MGLGNRLLFLNLFLVLTDWTVLISGLPEVQWFAPFFSGGGYCSESIAFVQSLQQTDLMVSIVQHGDSFERDFVTGLPSDTRKMLQAMSRKKHTPNAPLVSICHSEPGAWYPPRWPTARCPPEESTFTIGRTMFETDRLPEGWSERLNQMDQIWVPTKFAQQIFLGEGVVPAKLRVLGEPVDTDFFNPASVSSRIAFPDSRESFVFLSIFKWEERKGWDVLLEAYFSEFTSDDNVLLVILTNAYHSNDNFEEMAMKHVNKQYRGRHGKESSERLPKVHFHPRVDQSALPALYASADVFVLPSRGEGWGRPHVEAMSMGLPVIATNWSGPTEFMTPHNSYPLAINGLKAVKEGAFKGHLWANPSIPHLRQLMKYVWNHPQEVATKGLQARADMVEHYSIKVIGKKLFKLIEEADQLIHQHDEL